MSNEQSRRKAPVHVEPRPDGSWAVVREGNKKASGVHSTRERAEKQARSIADKDGSEVYVHDRQGRVRAHDSYDTMTAQTHEKALGEEVGSILVTRADTGAVERQAAYGGGEGVTWTVRVNTYPTIEESLPGGRTDPVGRGPAESESYEELSAEELKKRYPDLWKKIRSY